MCSIGCWSVLECRGRGVKSVGCEVCAAVEQSYEGKWLREDECVWAEKEGGKRVFKGGFEGGLARGILHYRSVAS